MIVHELEEFNPKIMEKQQIIIANKMDAIGAQDNLEEFKSLVPDVKIFPISAIKMRELKMH